MNDRASSQQQGRQAAAAKRKILVVDDEPQITRVLRTALESSGYEVIVANGGADALDKFLKTTPDLIVTDLSMPEMDGIQLTREVRQRAQTPVIVLSVRDQDVMKVRALDEGADDYVTKPFSIQELLARIRVQVRRTLAAEAELPMSLQLGDFHIDVDQHRVSRLGEDIHLTPKEFDLLLYFARNPERVLTHKMLLRHVWGPNGTQQPEYLRVLIGQLRKKVEPASEPRYIRSEPWVGYRFTPQPDGSSVHSSELL
ncbi:MAG TPA: response regulator transcription factor [Acidisarcina sp.]